MRVISRSNGCKYGRRNNSGAAQDRTPLFQILVCSRLRQFFATRLCHPDGRAGNQHASDYACRLNSSFILMRRLNQ
jgi:hypothetical protein